MKGTRAPHLLQQLLLLVCPACVDTSVTNVDHLAHWYLKSCDVHLVIPDG
jgi:hypothetical protein